MRTLLRVGGITGLLAGGAALALAPHAGLVTVCLIAAAGLAAGLATAKWLPSAWYGRQFGAGLRAGLIACVITVPTTLLALLAVAPHQSAALAASAGALVPLTWLDASVGSGVGVGALAVGFSALAALMLAALSARIFAADKGARFVKAVSRAREASQPLHAESVFAPMLARRTAVPLAAVAGGTHTSGAARLDHPTGMHPAPARMTPERRTLVPATPPEGIASSTVARRTAGPPVAPRRTIAPDLRALPPDSEPRSEPQRPPFVAPPAPVVSAPPASAPAPAAPALKRRGGGRPQASRLTPEMIEALAAWARDTEEDEEDENESANGAVASAARGGKERAAAREPVESSYLNAPAPSSAAKRKKRKKNATRDWIC